jgi:hypothetical protein
MKYCAHTDRTTLDGVKYHVGLAVAGGAGWGLSLAVAPSHVAPGPPRDRIEPHRSPASTSYLAISGRVKEGAGRMVCSRSTRFEVLPGHGWTWLRCPRRMTARSRDVDTRQRRRTWRCLVVDLSGGPAKERGATLPRRIRSRSYDPKIPFSTTAGQSQAVAELSCVGASGHCAHCPLRIVENLRRADKRRKASFFFSQIGQYTALGR